jgi:lipopolysaccharide biosynthesis glycosyltransferase
MKDIKIFISYHKQSSLLQNDCLVPIQVGAALAKSRFGAVHDDDGTDNISSKNPSLCELTAHYWAWRHCTADYVGFMHYRRHMIFKTNGVAQKENIYGLVDRPIINEKYIQDAGLTEQAIRNVVEQYDIIMPKAWDVRNVGSENVYFHYKSASPSLHIRDYDKVLSILFKKYPEYKQSADEYNKSHHAYFTNMFVMKREIFMHYSAWLFDIINEGEKAIDIEDYDIQEYRALAYIAEWLLGIYVTHQKKQGNFKYIELQRTFILQTYTDDKLEPAYPTNNIAICLNFAENYFRYGGITIKSLIDCASDSNNYDILVLNEDIADKSKKLIRELIADKKNISIRFIDVKKYFFGMEIPIHMYFTRAVYYRLRASSIFIKYDKVLYIDADTVVKRDLADLYATDITNYYAAAVPDYAMSGFRKLRVPSLLETGSLPANDYLLKHVELKNPLGYFQAGVILFNVKAIRRDDIENTLISLIEEKRYWFADQDIMNKTFEGKVKYLSFKWNVLHGNGDTSGFFDKLPFNIHQELVAAQQSPYIIHYAGENKPWQTLEVNFAEDFWAVARKTPWYERLLVELMDSPKRLHQTSVHRPFVQRLKNSYNKRKSQILRLTIRPRKKQFRIIILGKRLVNIGDFDSY